MNKALIFIPIFLAVLSCSEGDIIDNDLNFEAELQKCSYKSKSYVFYKIDSTINQTFFLNFDHSTFELDPIKPLALPLNSIEIPLNGTTNSVIHRKFNSSIKKSDYFCTSIPPSNILVTQELISSTGIAEIKYENSTENVTQITYTRTIILKDITLVGEGIAYRIESLILGADKFTVNK